jgi:hypothetical protein
MNDQRDRLDDAIDRVTARLTHVDEDPIFVSRVVAALPERVSWLGWLFHAWAPRLAMMAIVVGAATLVSRRGPAPIAPETNAPIVAVSPVTPPAELVAAVAPAAVSTWPLERLEPLERMEPLRHDHERSLAGIEAPAALAMQSLAPADLPADEGLSLAPLAIADLPMTAEFPPR